MMQPTTAPQGGFRLLGLPAPRVGFAERTRDGRPIAPRSEWASRSAIFVLVGVLILVCRAAAPAAGDEPVYPNGTAFVSLDLVNRVVRQRIDQTASVADYLMGAMTVGEAEIEGEVSARFVPDGERAVVDILLTGRSRARTTANFRDRVRIYSSSVSEVHARKRLQLNQEGLQAQRAIAWCPTRTTVNDIGARRRIVEWLARRRTQRKRGEMEVAASRQAARRVSQQLDEQAAKPLGDANETYREKLRQPLLERAAFPHYVRTTTSEQHLQLTVLHSNAGQRTGPRTPVEVDRTLDVAVYAHESMVENMVECLLGGRTIKDSAFLDFIEIITGSAPRALWVFGRRPRWSLTLARKRPVTVSFDGKEDCFELALHATGIEHGEHQFTGEVRITARYRMEKTTDGPHLLRGEPLEIQLTAAETSQSDIDWKPFLRRKFDAVFQPDLYFDGLVPPQGGKLAKLLELQLSEMSAEDGWFAIGYRLPDEQVASAPKTRGR